ncbi:MAG: hydrogenase [Thermoplasmata archaeon HGW-Thermoplasmata-1]|nr:MAG: hydrogenase [Thermoplasmata archaeon HGW-Thermoplasmata-1]
MFGPLETGAGYWTPLVWVGSMVVVVLVTLVIRGLGERTAKNTHMKGDPFMSGNPEVSKENSHVRAGNIYWGFLKAMEPYYKPLMKWHNGNVNDYVLMFIMVIAVLLLAIVLPGVF